ncbi:hypothetical protein GGI23_005637, partial [Coemansia sp. RSA 2559]
MNMSTSVSRPESVTGFLPSHAPAAPKPNKSHHDPPPPQARKPRSAHKASKQAPHNGLRNSASRGKLNNSDQRNPPSENDEGGSQQNEEDPSTPTKGGRHRGSRGGRGKKKQQQQQDMSVKPPSADNDSKSSKAAKQRSRRRQPSPPYLDNNGDDVVLFPSASQSTGGNYQQRASDRRLSKQQQQQRPASTPGGAFAPPPRMSNGNGTMPASTASMPAFGSPSRVRSPLSASKSNHYAGASFNNSPAPSSLPMPPSFLASPTKSGARTSVTRDEDVFGTLDALVANPERLTMGNSGYQQMAQPQSLTMQPPPAFAYHQAAAPSFGGGGWVNAALSERSRQLESMLASNGGTVVYQQHQKADPAAVVAGMHGSHSSVDLTHVGGDMAQKLRLIREMASNRPAT